MVLSLLPLLYNHAWHFDTKIASKKIRFKAGSLPRMINKEWLANLYIKLPNQLKNWQL